MGLLQLRITASRAEEESLQSLKAIIHLKTIDVNPFDIPSQMAHMSQLAYCVQ
jgi:hypothetical protein